MTDTDLPCQDKLPFKTKEEAEGAAVLAAHRYGSAKPKVYTCEHCGQFHLSANNTDTEM